MDFDSLLRRSADDIRPSPTFVPVVLHRIAALEERRRLIVLFRSSVVLGGMILVSSYVVSLFLVEVLQGVASDLFAGFFEEPSLLLAGESWLALWESSFVMIAIFLVAVLILSAAMFWRFLRLFPSSSPLFHAFS
jgi:hypothetical protein